MKLLSACVYEEAERETYWDPVEVRATRFHFQLGLTPTPVINSDVAEQMKIQFRDLPNTGASCSRGPNVQPELTINYQAAGNYTIVSAENQDGDRRKWSRY